ncbi:MAG: purine-nucleoside phosphorylase [Pyrodictiaceae archaeon]
MEIKPQHIRAPIGSIAEDVVVVGDPARARFLAEGLLEDARLVNEKRGFHVYTGFYKGLRVSVAVHGIGAPSAAIVFEELRAYGARRVVRLGTCGGLVEDLDIGDFVVATGALYNPGGTLGQYYQGVCPAASPDPELTLLVAEEASKRGRTRLGLVFSSDAFYAEDPMFAKRVSRLGAVAVEMEAAVLFSLSWMRGYRAAALLIVSDNLVVPGKEELRSHEELEEYVARGGEAVLEALRRMAGRS